MRSLIGVFLVIYFLLGVICWIVGLKAFGGRDRYVEYLKEEIGLGSASYYLCLVIFLLTWPLFLSDQ